MNFEGIENSQFYISLSYVTLIASIMTLILTSLIKTILKKKKIIYQGIDSSKKDEILAKVGRIVAIVIYSIIYISNELYLHHQITLNGALITGLLSGATLTLTISKGLYTKIRQQQKKKDVYIRLQEAEDELLKKKEEVIPKRTIILGTKEK